jgi:hypothetical protein
MDETPIDPAEQTPLWYYILKEAETAQNGERLGRVGGRIVAEVLLGLLDGDPLSYLSVVPNWKPELPGAHEGDFTMADLIRYAVPEQAVRHPAAGGQQPPPWEGS